MCQVLWASWIWLMIVSISAATRSRRAREGVVMGRSWRARLPGRAQETVVSSCEEQGDAEAKVGNAITEASGRALDQAVQAQPAQLVGDCALGDRGWIAS